MSRRILKLLMLSVLALFLTGLSNPVSAEGIEVGNGVKTGMNADEVKEVISDTENSEFDRWERALRGLKICARKGTKNYFVFSAATGKLLYKIMHIPKKHEPKIKAALDEKYGDPVVREITDEDPEYYYVNGKEGYKLIPDYSENALRLLHGDILLFNKVAEENDLEKWPKE